MYRIQLQDFEGPLDLLLFFIRRDELDIYDIPIAQITDEFLSYVRVMERIDLDGVAEFIYIAALLISIKAKMLLPKQEFDDEGEPIDPRRELVERLLDYMRYKEAAGHLAERHERRRDLFTRGDASAVVLEQPPVQDLLINTSIFDLIGALRRILVEAPAEPVHEIEHKEYSVEVQRLYVLDRLRKSPRWSFRDLVRAHPRGFIIATFLAVLELAKQGDIHLALTPARDDFTVQLSIPDVAGEISSQASSETL